MITALDSNLIPVYQIIGCKPEELSKFSQIYIINKIKEYYSNTTKN